MKIILSLLFFILSIKSSDVSYVIPFDYPLFVQCGVYWSDDVMGSNGDTICEAGDLLSSVSMALSGHGWVIDRQQIAPDILNNWLKSVGGYASGSKLDNSIICKLDSQHCSWIGFANADYPRSSIIHNLEEKKVVMVAYVYSPMATTYPDHFVLIVGYDTIFDSFYYTHDSRFEKQTYSLDKIAGYYIWSIDILNSFLEKNE